MGALDFDLEVNVPPQNINTSTSSGGVFKNEITTISISFDDFDEGDTASVTWNAGGGVIARSLSTARSYKL